MRINIELQFKDQIVLPINYNHILQATILNWIGDETYQNFLHDKGYQYNNRKYKLYTFSKIYGKYNIDRDNSLIKYFNKVNFTISSVEEEFFNYLVANVLKKEDFKLGNNYVQINKIETKSLSLNEKEKVYTLSPITTYSTFEKEEKKKTYYYSPFEKEFEDLIRENLIKKYIAVYEKEPTKKDFYIKPFNSSRLKESILIYKGIVIKAWNGEFIIEGSKELLNMAYNAGLGSKNSSGFGCIEIAKR